MKKQIINNSISAQFKERKTIIYLKYNVHKSRDIIYNIHIIFRVNNK